MSVTSHNSSVGIVIVGGGPVGATVALALAKQGIASTLLEARSQGAAYPDGRALALSYGSKLILERLGVWQAIAPKATPINTIHISQKGSFGRSILRAHEHQLPALGYVVAYGVLSAALDQALLAAEHTQLIYQTEVTHITPSSDSALIDYKQNQQAQQLSCALAVLADGGRSLQEIAGLTREVKEYGHDALVTKVQAQLPHQHVAYERFTSKGPVALLPNGETEFSLVWTGKQAEIQPLLDLDDATFLKQLHAHFGDRVGQFLSVGKRLSFPLKLATLKPSTAPHLAVIGNAAQTMHPVAGQGFNVGLRDAYELAQQIAATPVERWGDAAMLQTYQQGRQVDTQRGLLFTDFLVNIFSNDIIGLSAIRGLGLGLLDVVVPLKQKIVSKMSFGSHG
jgi:2-octaprenyl-6-methoxyphenol hydroxylase